MLTPVTVKTSSQALTEAKIAQLRAEAVRLGYEVSVGAIVANDGEFSQTMWYTPRRDEK